jgi:WD40 repeat protein
VVDKSIPLTIQAHDTEIGALAINPEGTIIASASMRGHIIKLFSSDNGEVVQELKRGNSKAEIQEIIFHPSLFLLACTSSKSSIHIFEFNKAIQKCTETRQYSFNTFQTQSGEQIEAKNKKSG